MNPSPVSWKKNALMVKGRSTDSAPIPRERRLQSYSQDQKRWTWGPLETEFSFSRVKRRRELRQGLYDGERKHDRPRQSSHIYKRRLFGLKRGTTSWNTLKRFTFKPCFADQCLNYVIFSPRTDCVHNKNWWNLISRFYLLNKISYLHLNITDLGILI